MQPHTFLLIVWACISSAVDSGERGHKHAKRRPRTAMELLHKGQAADQAGKKGSALKLYERSISSARGAGMDVETLITIYRAAIAAARGTGEDNKRRKLLYEFIDVISASPSEALLQATSEVADLEEAAGNLLGAYEVIERAVRLSPTTHQLQNSAGSLMLRLSRPRTAIYHFKAALASSEAEAASLDSSPPYGDLYGFNLGLALSRINDYAGAYDVFARAKYYRRPRLFPEADYRMGLCLDNLGRYRDAAKSFELVIAQYKDQSDPDMFSISGGLSQVRWDLHNAYLSSFRNLDGLVQLKIALNEEKVGSARLIYGALHLSRYVSTWSHAEELTRKALTALNGEFKACTHQRCQTELTPMRALAWAPAPVVSQVLKVWQTNVMRFQSNEALGREANASAELWGRHGCVHDRQQNTRDDSTKLDPSKRTKKRKIKRRILSIGYVSADWETFHPMAPILKGLLHSQRAWRGEARHATTKRRIKVFCFDTRYRQKGDSAVRKAESFLLSKDSFRLSTTTRSDAELALCDEYIDLRSAVTDLLNDATPVESIAANLVIKYRVDVMFDLNGYTSGGWPELFAERPCPVQISWLGWPVTGGNNALFDFALTDSAVQPPETFNIASHWVEPLSLLPQGQLFPPASISAGLIDDPESDDQIADLEDRVNHCKFLGLPPAAIVLAAHNQGYKFTPQLVDTIAAILKRISQTGQTGVLWLIEHPAEGTDAIRYEFLSRGLSASLVISSPFEGIRDRHIQRLQQCADVFLDSAGMYSGGATLTDAIAASLPVVALSSRAGLNDKFQIMKQWDVPSGSSPVSRLAASLIAGNKLNQPNLRVSLSMNHLVSGLKEYEDTVVHLALYAKTMARIRSETSFDRNPNLDHLALWGSVFTRSIFAMVEVKAAEMPRTKAKQLSDAHRWNVFNCLGTFEQ